jgi:predicted transcriptional regulator
MLVEVPDLQAVVSVIVAFLVGVFGMIIYTKIKVWVGQKTTDPSYLSRLEYYERQLIDMKIRLDVLDLEQKMVPEPVVDRIAPILEKNQEFEAKKESERPVQRSRMPNMDFNGISEFVLGLITTKEMTSRDIQITISRSREHTSRLMKRLFEEGLVERNTKKKPFTYKITEKGRARVGKLEQSVIA